MDASEWRTIDKEKYQFSCNGGEKYTVNDMLRLGYTYINPAASLPLTKPSIVPDSGLCCRTYNALIGETELYNAKVIGTRRS